MTRYHWMLSEVNDAQAVLNCIAFCLSFLSVFESIEVNDAVL